MRDSSIVPLFLFLLLNFFSVSGCWANDDGSVSSYIDKSPLRMVSGSGFKIALFADLHYGENAWTDWGPAQDVKSDRVMSTVLDSEKPDFVVYLGDVITANNIAIQNASLYWDTAVSPTRKRGIPWASVFGNHDDAYFEWPSEWFSATGIPEVNCPPPCISYSAGYEPCTFRGTTRVELMKAEITNNKLSCSINGPKELSPGVSNYVSHVLSSDGTKPALLMYFFDSGGGSYPEVISYAQALWFKKQSELLNPNAK
jgi:hypothetical protein